VEAPGSADEDIRLFYTYGRLLPHETIPCENTWTRPSVGSYSEKLVRMKYRALVVCGGLFFALGLSVPGADVISIWGGARGTIVMKSDGTVWTWGANFGGKLGLGVDSATLGRVLVPAEVHGPGNVGFFNSIKAIMGGEAHNTALRSDGTVWSWGMTGGMMGLLGDGTTNNACVPVQTSNLNSVVALGGRDYHTLAVESNGSIWAWGWNSTGALGDGTTNATLVPVQVVGLTNPAVVSGGYHFSMALMPDGTVYQWGLGRVIGSSYTPAQIPGFSNVTAISCGWDHALALKSDGTVWAWGLNGYGEVGDGTTSNRTVPVQVVGLSNVVAVSGGDWHSAALRSDGTVWKWGRNDTGQLGNGSADGAAHPIPARILLDNYGAGFSNVVMVAARDYHNIAVKADGSVWQWGANDQGQCGVNTTDDLRRPAMVSGLGPRVGLPLNLALNAPGSVDLYWRSGTGEYFSIEYMTNLTDGLAGVLQSNILASPPTNTVTVPMTNARCYYRLRF
jgi:alpha-tubulin suppressor-like RCC1 family protein